MKFLSAASSLLLLLGSTAHASVPEEKLLDCEFTRYDKKSSIECEASILLSISEAKKTVENTAVSIVANRGFFVECNGRDRVDDGPFSLASAGVDDFGTTVVSTGIQGTQRPVIRYPELTFDEEQETEAILELSRYKRIHGTCRVGTIEFGNGIEE